MLNFFATFVIEILFVYFWFNKSNIEIETERKFLLYRDDVKGKKNERIRIKCIMQKIHEWNQTARDQEKTNKS